MAKIASTTIRKGSANTNGRGSGYQAEIEKLAYQFFVERGYEHGHDREDWNRAEVVIRSRYSS